MAEPVSYFGVTKDPLVEAAARTEAALASVPSPIEVQLGRIAALEAEAARRHQLYLDVQHDRHAIGLELTLARRELAELLGRTN